jgi:hypothetical protein
MFGIWTSTPRTPASARSAAATSAGSREPRRTAPPGVSSVVGAKRRAAARRLGRRRARSHRRAWPQVDRRSLRNELAERGEHGDDLSEEIHLVWGLRGSASAWRTKGESGLTPLVHSSTNRTATRSGALPLSHSRESTHSNSRQLTHCDLQLAPLPAAQCASSYRGRSPTGTAQGHSPLRRRRALGQRAKRQVSQVAALSEEHVLLQHELHVAWRQAFTRARDGASG